ncbi:6,7-dimethyl-8-ribityllumazine synthase [Segetibacter sp. 3557_3]|uniref:6,7-dimethyl-8-ribityllumazine synthase n=1 Tax=Segetibacter sp. 3557_3 TaxID=2547429 RepID=UPI001058DEEB|nr:6,7-dimethyl-8-ribityllumazine synthase [Segetibacter sp. 3557_3]TDH29157.1 6,7-dimethyl-8-ribityllumazine synthase [Segetibacter sp. 3557_3]
MATKGNSELIKGIPQIKDAFVVIVKTEWNAHIVNELALGCEQALTEAGVTYETITVPGAFEIPFIIRRLHDRQNGNRADAFIALGSVVRGDTPHFDYVCKGVTDGIVQLNLTLDVPVIFGILTVNNEEQAQERIGGVHGHKGQEAALTAIKMIGLNRQTSF